MSDNNDPKIKPLHEKLLKEGVIPKETAEQFEKWGVLERGASELVPEKPPELSEERLEQVSTEVDELLEENQKARKEVTLD